MTGRVVIGGLVGGVVIFVWGAVTHMATPLGMAGFSFLPTDREGAAVAAMGKATPADGLYLFPKPPCVDGHVSESEQNAWLARVKSGPSGMLLIRHGNAEVMSPGQLGTELATDVLAALIASVLLTTTRLRYSGRVGFVTLLGLFGWVTVSLPYWNWYGFPLDFTLAAAVEEGAGWLLAGLALAALVRPARAAV